jgi:hypothetical protein
MSRRRRRRILETSTDDDDDNDNDDDDDDDDDNEKKIVLDGYSIASAPAFFSEPTVQSPPRREEEDHAVLVSSPSSSFSSWKRHCRNFQKWGIPMARMMDAPEIILMGRLVWFHYRQRYWWPAILYKNYREIQKHQSKVWKRLSGWRRMSLARLIALDSTNPRNHVPIARLLGRPLMELVEVVSSSSSSSHNSSDGLSDFASKLPSVLPRMNCNGDYFRNDPGLYYDWHVAMDQVEQLLQDCLGQRLASSLPVTKVNTIETTVVSSSWLQRAKDAERAKWAAASTPAGCFSCLCGSEPEEAEEFSPLRFKQKLQVY